MRKISLFLILLLCVFSYGCGANYGNSGSSTTSTTPTTITGSTAAISISNFLFSPASIIISTGTTVTWTNNDSAPHTATKTSGPASFDSGTLNQGGTYPFKFTVVGTYEYNCTFHTYMTGKVTVNP